MAGSRKTAGRARIDEGWETLAEGVDRWRPPAGGPARRLITGRMNRRVGGFWSWKNRAHVVHESCGEERCARTFEVHPGVAAYRSQPETLRVDVGQARPLVYTPDFLVDFDGVEVFVEYKPLGKLHAPAPLGKWDERG